MARLSLRYLIVGPYFLLSLAALAVVGADAVRLVREEIRHAARARYAETARTLAGFPLQGDALRKVERVVGADVATIDFEGRVRESTLPDLGALELSSWLAANPRALEANGEEIPLEVAGRRGYLFYAPVPEEEGPLLPYRGVALFVPAEEFEARWGMAARQMVALGAATLAGVLALGYGLAVSIARPIRRLVDRADRIAGGDLESRTERSGAAELARLADAFDRMVEGLLESRRRLADAERLAALGRLAASLAHEVRNPLTSIRMTVERVRERTVEPETARSLQVVQADIARLERTAEDLLYSARPSPPALETVEPGAILDEILALFGRQLAHREIEVATAYPDPRVAVRADPRRMKQLFMNLLLNAMAAVGSAGRIEVEVEVEVASAGDRLRVTFRDTGPGVPPAERERIFEPFVALREGGTGLGLAVSRRIVEDHGGTIRCADSDRGAVFVVELPLPRETPS